MPTSIRVMSWNVESFGDAKAQVGGQPSAAIPLIAQVIRGAGADLVGLMELKAGVGEWVAQQLVIDLNNTPATGGTTQTWDADVSSRQDGGTFEEYIYLWRTDTGKIKPNPDGNPGPTSLIGVVDRQALATVIARNKWKDADVAKLLKGIVDAGYGMYGRFKGRGNKFWFTETVRVDRDVWNDLDTQNLVKLDLSKTGAPKLSGQDQVDLAARLHGIDVLRFTGFDDRSPYVGHFVVGGRFVTVALLHAPGPNLASRAEAINNMALSKVLPKAQSLVIMGDFNIDEAAERKLKPRLYTRDTPSGFGVSVPRDYGVVFQPITGQPLGARNFFTKDLTSLRNVYAADTANLMDVMANPYDKIFVRGNVNLNAKDPRVENVLARIVKGMPLPYDVDLARQTLLFYRQFRGAAALAKARTDLIAYGMGKPTAKLNRLLKSQVTATKNWNAAKKPLDPKSATAKRYNQVNADVLKQQLVLKALSDEVNNLDAFAKLEASKAQFAPTGVGSAHAAFRYALTDHLPVSIQLNAK